MSGFSYNIVEVSLFIFRHLVEPTISFQLWVAKYGMSVPYPRDLLFAFLPSVPMKYTVIAALGFSVKFLLLIALLVFVRGGIPRYRYDFLTKIGWIKFLSLVLAVFLSSLLLIFLA
jgi:NADH:ubiquinone oxidoreductase subunit H